VASQRAEQPVRPRAASENASASSNTSASAGSDVAGSGAGSGRGPGGPGTGDGSGGDGSGGARPAYGRNPKPPYPLAARRLGLEGVVTLEVLVRPDGSPGEVVVRQSSGHHLLDESALSTVQRRWQFIPARRGDMPVESRVTFPIRFTLRDG